MTAAAVLTFCFTAASACDYEKTKEEAQTPVPSPTAQAPVQGPVTATTSSEVAQTIVVTPAKPRPN
jgi:hypothetical protein